MASIVAGFAMLAFTAASCDIFDPYDPGDPGNGGGGGGGRDTIIIDDPIDSNWNGGGRDTSGNHDDDNDPASFVRSEGTIVWVNVEGGFWGIEAANGHEYEPVNLAPEFQVIGLRVVFTGKLLNWGTMHMWGEVLEVGEMSKV
jgi:hypothetical protein